MRTPDRFEQFETELDRALAERKLMLHELRVIKDPDTGNKYVCGCASHHVNFYFKLEGSLTLELVERITAEVSRLISEGVAPVGRLTSAIN